MPIFVEWKWKEQRESFLVTFHFYDDFSKSNLRIKKYAPSLVTYKDDQGKTNGFMSHPMKITYADLSKGEALVAQKAWMTWAPLHFELALLSDLLSYANIVNGLNPTEKRKLKNKLEAKIETTLPYGRQAYSVHPDVVDGIGKYRKIAMCDESLTKPKEHARIGVELCAEYIDYLRKLVEPYIRT